MKERFKQLPEPLQQQVIRRFAVAIVFVLLFFITLFGFWDVYLFLPCLLFAGFFIVNALRLFYTCIRGDYISVSGTCVQVETTAIRKRIKSLTLEYEEEAPSCTAPEIITPVLSRYIPASSFSVEMP